MLKVHYSTMDDGHAAESINYTLNYFNEKGYEIKEIRYQSHVLPSKQAFPDVYITTMILYDDQPMKSKK